jgi:hypothetical protein
MKYVFLLFVVLSWLGCDDAPTLKATPSELPADGKSTTVITFTDNLFDGTRVDFRTDRGYFEEAEGAERQTHRTMQDGRATVELVASDEPGTATITAYTYAGDTQLNVEFVPRRPSGSSFHFFCDIKNLAAFDDRAPDLAAPCHLRLQDRHGQAIEPEHVPSGEYGFLAEAGAIQAEQVVGSGSSGRFFLYEARGGQSAPYDVEPLPGEPSRLGRTGRTHNPRDGLVTVLAWARGEEGFHDINSNGRFDPDLGETFDDRGEPFLDVDDDGRFDPVRGDTAIDVNGDGEYTPANGVWDADTVLWATTKLLWTGAPHQSSETSRIELQTQGAVVPAGAMRAVTIRLLDGNMNPVAAAEGDQFSVISDCAYACTLSTNSFSLTNTMGFTLDESGQVVGDLFEAPVYEVSVTNTNQFSEPLSFIIRVTMRTTPAPLTSTLGRPVRLNTDLIPMSGRLLGLEG